MEAGSRVLRVLSERVRAVRFLREFMEARHAWSACIRSTWPAWIQVGRQVAVEVLPGERSPDLARSRSPLGQRGARGVRRQCVGVTVDGHTVILGFAQTATENRRLCATYLRGLVECGFALREWATRCHGWSGQWRLYPSGMIPAVETFWRRIASRWRLTCPRR
jgi:hypothetical protein